MSEELLKTIPVKAGKLIITAQIYIYIYITDVKTLASAGS